jgi:hypothetical protein
METSSGEGIQTMAWAAFLRRAAEAIQHLADDLAKGDGHSSQPGQIAVTDLVRGSRQKQIVGLSGLRTETGLTTRAISQDIGYAQPNVYGACEELERRGFLEKIPHARPVRYRLAIPYRR